jgi:hypothetical protein
VNARNVLIRWPLEGKIGEVVVALPALGDGRCGGQALNRRAAQGGQGVTGRSRLRGCAGDTGVHGQWRVSIPGEEAGG